MGFIVHNPVNSRCLIRRNSATVMEQVRFQRCQASVIRIAAILLLGISLPLTGIAAAQDSAVTTQWLQERVEKLREETHLVGVGATLMIEGEITAAAVAGTRRQGSDVGVTVDDKWHIGSITKSMTATVIGKLVERGQLSWDSRLPEVLPEMATTFDPSWGEVTLHHLLTHTSGLPANFSILTKLDWPDSRDAVHIRRKVALTEILAEPAASSPGTAFVYSNVGYTLAGLIAAETAHTTWEALIEEELFKPLAMPSAGFGPPYGDQPLDQPWGHRRALFMRSPMDPRGRADNTPVMGPAGSVHLSMADLARFGWEHLQGESGNSKLLQQQTFQKLHAPAMRQYGCGWVNKATDWKGGSILWHNGSNTMWYALLVLIPSQHAVLVCVTNDGDFDGAEPQFFQLAETISSELTVRN